MTGLIASTVLIAITGYACWHLYWHVVATAGVTLLHRPGSRLSRGKSGERHDRRVHITGVTYLASPGTRARTTAPGFVVTRSKA